ncbi:MAG: hypothetical protein OXC93_05115 [Rhodospirillaceae bacterium]|nr:hypothetical protein [Rhodospirillaceae bacterium]
MTYDSANPAPPMLPRSSAVLNAARMEPRMAGEASPIGHPEWTSIASSDLADVTAEEWVHMNAQRAQWRKTEVATQALEMLAVSKDAPGFGYQINNYEHCLQSATLALQDGQDEETIVVTLFHDIGFVACNETHGEFAAELLRPYVDEIHVWTLQRHMYFQAIHCTTCPGVDGNLREKWRGHPWFDWAANWVRKYDLASVNANLETAPISVFEPMVHRVFGREPKVGPLPE